MTCNSKPSPASGGAAALFGQHCWMTCVTPTGSRPLGQPACSTRPWPTGCCDRSNFGQVVVLAAQHGDSRTGLMGALAYFDGYRSARLPTNLIQAQRDYFGAHTYERIDAEGTFHTDWKRS